MDATATWLAVLLALCGVYIAMHTLAEPARYAWHLLRRAALGYLALLAANSLGMLLGYHLPLNPVTALVAGVLGLPGVVAVVALHLLYV